MGRPQTFQLWKHFKQGRALVDDDLHLGWPSMLKTDENITTVYQVIHSNCHLTV
jgi:hypothetical protein